MIKLALRGARANLGRLILTLISVVLGVAFVSGSFVLADSLRSIFDQVSEDAFAGVDAQVRGASNDMNSTNGETPRFDDSIVSAIAELPEANYTEGGLFSFERAYTVDANDEVVRPTGPPVFTGSWAGPSPVSSFRIIEGEPPVGQQVVIDPVQAERGGFVVGQDITISLPTGEPEVFTLSGTIDFGEGGTGGAFFILFDLPTTQRVLGLPGQIDSVVVSAAVGVSPDELVAAI